MIGFEQSSYTFIEAQQEELLEISMATEGGRRSEQTFKVEFQLVTITSSDLYPPATLGEDFVSETITVQFEPFVERMMYQFTLLPDSEAGEMEVFHIDSFSSADSQFPPYLSPSLLSTGTDVFIVDLDGMH